MSWLLYHVGNSVLSDILALNYTTTFCLFFTGFVYVCLMTSVWEDRKLIFGKMVRQKSEDHSICTCDLMRFVPFQFDCTFKLESVAKLNYGD